MANYTNLLIGTEVYYTGDMANADGFGKIVAVREATKFSPKSYDIGFGPGRNQAKGIMPQMFAPSPGRRFWLKTEYDTHRAARIAQMLASYPRP